MAIKHMWQSRSNKAEWLDQLDTSGPDLTQTLHQLSLINRWLGTHQSIIRALDQVVKTQDKSEGIMILDLGCGGGDLLRKVADWGRKRDFQLKLIGLDGNAHTLEYATQQSLDYPEIHFLQQDLLTDTNWPSGVDLVISSQFLYHYDDAQLATVFKQVSTQSRLGLIASELHRNPLAYALFALLTFFLPVHPMIRHDGLQAIKRAFRRAELRSILRSSGLSDFRLRWVWAFRFQLIIFTSAYA
ncbi:MAG: methyltransferase domain-containing protein [Bacteroidota bacterium]